VRIVGGTLRGRRLASRPARSTRPTSDRVREGVASALEARGAIVGAHVLDLFAGTGALGLEALSRGADRLVAVDAERAAARCIGDNTAALDLQERVQVLQLDLNGAPANVAARLTQIGLAPFTLVFADPPYTLIQAAVTLLDALAEHGLIAPRAIVVVEHAQRQAPVCPPRFAELASYRYGDSGIALWETIAVSIET
jgi:16S rRNA (guanine966-N2)-methyltransferase